MMESSTILQWLNTHPHLAGLATFIISAAESVAIIGTIVPGSVMMTAIGALAGADVIPLWSTLIWATLGAILGDSISYWLGYNFKDRIHSIWPFRSHPYLLGNGEKFFHKYGSMSVFIGRFVGPVRALVPMVAGMLRMKPLRFAIANITSAIGWAPAYMLPGILLGAAALELPPDIAVQAILTLLLIVLFIVLCVWSLQKLLSLIGQQIDQFLNGIWKSLDRSRYFHLVTDVLTHYNPKKTHGQLTLAFYFIVTSIFFSLLTIQIYFEGSVNIAINQVIFHLFRSLRSVHGIDDALLLTLLGQKDVLLPVMLILVAWFALTKRFRTAAHVFVLTFLTAGSAWLIKNLIHSPRPWGITAPSYETFSFPSGHATLAGVFYFGLALLMIKALQPSLKRYWPFYFIASIIVLCISLSRLYLGAHWFTDILGGWLLSAVLLMLVTLSYNRKAEKPLKLFSIILVTLISLSLSYGYAYYSRLDKMKKHYALQDWPTHIVSVKDWWQLQMTGTHLPQFRINRFGLHSERFSIQWAGDIQSIKSELLKNNWKEVPPRDWISILHRITGIESTEELPLVSALHLDKQPVLVLIKHLNGSKKLIALRLWDSNIVIPALGKLWVGSVEIVPKTYSWFLRRNENQVPITTSILFPTTPKPYQLKIMTVTFTHKKNKITEDILLIRPAQ